MTDGGLADFLSERIPLSEAMQIEVREATPLRVALYAPLAPNANHRGTGFGGSLATLAILAAWSLVFLRMRESGRHARVVIRRNTMSYDRPVEDGFTATAVAPSAGEWARVDTLLDRGRAARVSVQAQVECRGESAGEFVGQFAILPLGASDAPE